MTACNRIGNDIFDKNIFYTGLSKDQYSQSDVYLVLS